MTSWASVEAFTTHPLGSTVTGREREMESSMTFDICRETEAGAAAEAEGKQSYHPRCVTHNGWSGVAAAAAVAGGRVLPLLGAAVSAWVAKAKSFASLPSPCPPSLRFALLQLHLRTGMGALWLRFLCRCLCFMMQLVQSAQDEPLQHRVQLFNCYTSKISVKALSSNTFSSLCH